MLLAAAIQIKCCTYASSRDSAHSMTAVQGQQDDLLNYQHPHHEANPLRSAQLPT